MQAQDQVYEENVIRWVFVCEASEHMGAGAGLGAYCCLGRVEKVVWGPTRQGGISDIWSGGMIFMQDVRPFYHVVSGLWHSAAEVLLFCCAAEVLHTRLKSYPNGSGTHLCPQIACCASCETLSDPIGLSIQGYHCELGNFGQDLAYSSGKLRHDLLSGLRLSAATCIRARTADMDGGMPSSRLAHDNMKKRSNCVRKWLLF
jgi:hypothetical protein